MKVTFINHSCFSIELDHTVLIFDYTGGQLPEFQEHKKVCLFSSHSHWDHFNTDILAISSKYDHVIYILSDDIKIDDKTLERCHMNHKLNTIHYVKPDAHYQIDHISFSTLLSTDLGVAYNITCEGTDIYYAGDLYWWHWNEQSEDWNTDMGKRYRKEIAKLENKHFHIAFLPLDGRLADKYALGFDYFVTHVEADYIFPMHFWEDYSLIPKLCGEDYAFSYRDKIMQIEYQGQQWDIK